MDIIHNILYFGITIGVLVFVHELGHFLAAISCGMRAEVFALGMGNRVLGWNKKTKFSFGKLPEGIDLEGNTDYRVAAFPVGGYVKISGMIDESFDTEFAGSEPQPWEYRSKPIWQRMIVISAGVIMNIILAIGIFWGINYQQGGNFWKTNEVGMVVKDSPADKNGIRVGDKILSVNGVKIEYWETIQTVIYFEDAGKDISMEIERNGKTETLVIPQENIPDISESSFGIEPINTEPAIAAVFPGTPAEKAGLKVNDAILSINGLKVFNQEDVIKIIKSHPQQSVDIEIRRDGTLQKVPTIPSEKGLIGIQVGIRYTGPTVNVKYGLFESFPKGVEQTINATMLFVHSIKQIIVGKAEFSKSVGGPVKIAEMATRSAEIGLASFLAFMALLSISLAVMNILPFPALDGGHLAILIYEAVTKKPLPHIVLIRVQQVGMIILLSFMAFVLYNDIFG